MNASNWLETAVLNHFFRSTATTAPARVYLALYISDPTDADIGTEVQGGGYVRQQITFSAPVQADRPPPAQGTRAQIQNTAEVRFPVATANWGNISHFGIRTAATGGNLLAHAPVPTPRQIENGDEAVFRVDALAVTLD